MRFNPSDAKSAAGQPGIMLISTATGFTALFLAPSLLSLSPLSPSSTPTAIPTPDPMIPTCATFGTPFGQPAAQALITQICAQPQLNAQFVPAIALGNQWNAQAHEPKRYFQTFNYPLNDGSGNTLWARVRYSSLSVCSGGSFNGKYQCVERFSTVLNGCQTDTISAKLGGSLTFDCGEYDLVVADKDPFPDPDPGNFLCEDNSPAPDSGPPYSWFPDSCVCWYANAPGQSAFFAKSLEGNCVSADVDFDFGLLPDQGY